MIAGNDTGTARLRLRFAALAACTIGAGLLVHERGAMLGQAARDILGDALWAAMMFWLISAMVPGARLIVRCAAAGLVSAAVETSQLYHSPALDAIRSTPLGRLVLGSGFDLRDFAAYGAGVLVAALLEAALRRRIGGVHRAA